MKYLLEINFSLHCFDETSYGSQWTFPTSSARKVFMKKVIRTNFYNEKYVFYII